MPSFSAFGYTECFKKSKNISFQLIPSEKRKEEFFLKWIKSIKLCMEDFLNVILILMKAVLKEI